ncbi:unnamed protein product, partial [Mesorhabditis spiculigera]
MNLTDIARMSEREAIESFWWWKPRQDAADKETKGSVPLGMCAVHLFEARWWHARDSRLPIKSVLLLVYLWSTGLSSVQQLSKEMGDVAATTVIDWCRYLRDVCGWATSERLKESRIGGPGTICELDETVMSRRKYHRGRIVKARWLFGGICRETKEMFAVLVPDRRAETLMGQHHRPHCAWHHDHYGRFASYKGLADHPDYNWQWVNHKENFVKPGHPQVHSRQLSGRDRRYRLSLDLQCGVPRRTLCDLVTARMRGQVESYVAEGIWRQLHGNDDAFKRPFSRILLFWPPGTDIDSVPFYAEE